MISPASLPTSSTWSNVSSAPASLPWPCNLDDGAWLDADLAARCLNDGKHGLLRLNSELPDCITQDPDGCTTERNRCRRRAVGRRPPGRPKGLARAGRRRGRAGLAPAGLGGEQRAVAFGAGRSRPAGSVGRVAHLRRARRRPSACPLLRRRSRAYLSSTRVPRIFCALSVLRNVGSSRSISSKYDESAGVELVLAYREFPRGTFRNAASRRCARR